MNRIIAENEAVGYYKTSRSGKAHKIRDFFKKTNFRVAKKRDKQVKFFTDHVKRCERKMHADDSTCIIDVVIFYL
jgi:hypothetical protein